MTIETIPAEGGPALAPENPTFRTSSPTIQWEHGLERQIAALEHGDHLCAIYEDPAQQMRAVVPFIEEGLRQGNHCVYIADQETTEEAAARLSEAGVNVPRHVGRRELVLLTQRDVYLRDGPFDPDEKIRFLESSIEQSIADGFTGYRVTGEMTWALGDGIDCEGLIEYEALLNRFFPDQPALGLCQYDRNRFPAHIVYDVLRTHPLAVLGDQVCTNLYFEPPELMLEGGHVEERVEWMITQLQRWRRLSVSRDELQREVDDRKRFEERLKQAATALERSNRELEHFA